MSSHSRQTASLLARRSGTGTVRLWNATTGAGVLTVEGQPQIAAMAFSHDGEWIASRDQNGAIRVIQAATGTPFPMAVGHAQFVRCVTFHPDSTRVASGACDGTLHIFDIASGSLILERSVTIASEGFRPTGINAVAFSLDGTRVLTVDNHGEICTWDVATGGSRRSRC